MPNTNLFEKDVDTFFQPSPVWSHDPASLSVCGTCRGEEGLLTTAELWVTSSLPVFLGALSIPLQLLLT